MLDKFHTLSVVHNETDYTPVTREFALDELELDFTTAPYIYIGHRKPINAVFFNIIEQEANNPSITTGEYYNGTEWRPLADFTDHTRGFYRSGFLKFNRVQDGISLYEIADKTEYWYRFRSEVLLESLKIEGVGLVFSDDIQLQREVPLITDVSFLGSRKSHILAHTAARDEIIQKFRNKDYIVRNGGKYRNLEVFDLHDIDEVRLASVYLALSKIYLNSSDSPTDTWADKANLYRDYFNKYINIARLSVDVNDDGEEQSSENKPILKNKYITR